MRFDEHFVRGALPTAILVDSLFPKDTNFSIDTRTMKKGDIFIALSGSLVDGHDFIGDALKKGAAGLIIQKDKQDLLKTFNAEVLKSIALVAVDNTLTALIRLAQVWRAQFDYPVIAIAGSVGKTSTKEMLAHILSTHTIPFVVSHQNQNTKIGVALNILRMRTSHEVAIFEVGIAQRGEMKEIADLLRPSSAVITNIGHSHMEGLGSLSDIAAEKRGIFSCFSEDSVGIINGDQPLLSDVGYPHPVIKFGSKTINQIQARKIIVADDTISFSLKLYNKKYSVVLGHTHQGAVFNALAAASVAYLLHIPDATIIEGLQKPCSIAGRFERKQLKNNKGLLIHDAYNANPESMKASLLAFQHITTDAQKVIVLGDMLELGISGPFWHRQVGRFLRKISSLRHVILVGNMVSWTKKMVPVGMSIDHVSTWEEALVKLKEHLDKESLVLVKGSHGMQLAELVHEVTV